MSWRKHPDKIRKQANALKRGERERAQMERLANLKETRMLSGLFGNEKYVQNIWIVLPVSIERSDFIRRFNRSFSDVGKIKALET